MFKLSGLFRAHNLLFPGSHLRSRHVRLPRSMCSISRNLRSRNTDLLISIHYVSASIYIYMYTLFQLPDRLLRCSESIREKDKEGPSCPSARNTATSLQIPR